MRSISISKVFVLGFAGAAGLSMISPAMAAGRCGGALSIDSPTTLASVALRCNVNLSELYEANPSIDPSNVRPGERLAIPKEKDQYTSGASFVSAAPTAVEQDEPVSDYPYIVSSEYEAPATDNYSTSIADADDYRGNELRRAHRVRVRDMRVSASSPLWLQPETDGATLYSVNDRLSFQKTSAMRIHNAGTPSVGRPVPITVTRTPMLKSAALANAPTKLIECNTLEETTSGKIHEVRQIISTPEKTFVEIKENPESGGFDCRLVNAADNIESPDGVPPARFTGPSAKADYHLPDYSRIGVTPKAIKINEEFSLSGEVMDSTQGCLVLRTNDNRMWRLSTPAPAVDMVGKAVTVWGKSVAGGACGGGASMVVSHAVYAEPWDPAQ